MWTRSPPSSAVSPMGDDAVLADPETFSDFKQAVFRLQSQEPLSWPIALPRAAINAALRQAFTIGGVPDDPDGDRGGLH